MKILLVYAHPEPTSFNHALKEEAISELKNQSHEVVVSDLYKMNFNPVADWQDFKKIDPALPRQYGVVQRDAFLSHQLKNDIQEEQKKLTDCDAVIFQFPIWWFGMPAILKGWFDRVLAAGFAYDKDKWFADGLLKPKKALLSVTTQSPESAYQKNAMHGDIEQYLFPIHHTLHFTGIHTLSPFVAYGVMNIDDSARKNYLVAYRSHLRNEILSNIP